MKQMTDEEIQQVLLSILKYLDSLCCEHGLHYMLCSGTCLGAIRHRGFIPWDNDADIMLPREDYEKLLSLLYSKSKKPYKVLTMENCPDYIYPFAKVIDSRTFVDEPFHKKISNYGVFVDIFPVDGLPPNEKERNKHIRKLRKLVLCLRSKTAKHSMLKQIATNIRFCTRSKFYFCKKINRIAAQYKISASDYVMDVIWGTKFFYRKTIEAFITIPFENFEFKVSKYYDDYLKMIYGDYLELPPISERYKHDIKAYWR